jgi:hypothetical protein
MVKDITEKKQIEEELNESEAARKENEFRLNSILTIPPHSFLSKTFPAIILW